MFLYSQFQIVRHLHIYIYIYVCVYIYSIRIQSITVSFTILLCFLIENLNRGQENAQKQNNLPKLRELCVVLQKIDEASKKRPIKIDEPLKKRRKKKI